MALQDEPEPHWVAVRRAIAAVVAEDAAADYDERAAIRAGRKQAGLPVDDEIIAALLRRSAAGLAHQGTWETPEERARRQHGEAVIAESFEMVDAYTDAHAASHAGTWVEWSSNEPTLVVAFTDDPQRHAAALDRPRVRVIRHERALAELAPIAEAVGMAQLRGDAPPGTLWIGAGVNETDNVVDVMAIGPDEQAAAAWLGERYGEVVRLVWRGSAEPLVRPVPWHVWETSPEDPNVLTIRWQANSADPLERVDVDEAFDAIRITVFQAAPAGFTTLVAQDRRADVRLAQPVGERAVVDGATGRQRSRL